MKDGDEPERSRLEESIRAFGAPIAVLPGERPVEWSYHVSHAGDHSSANEGRHLALTYERSGRQLTIVTIKRDLSRPLKEVARQLVISGEMMKSGDLTKENFKKMLALEVEQGGQPDLLVDGDFVNASYLAVGGFTAVIVEGKMDVVILGGNIRELVTYIHP